jgi:Fur family peroxide stress response transcriptional regulator
MKGRSDLDYIAVLKAHGFSVTYQRLAVYRVLHDSTEHLSAEEIHKKVIAHFPMITLATIYKNLERLNKAGIVQKVSTMKDVSLYEAKINSHHHLFCIKCQAIHDITDPIGKNKLSLPKGHGFEVLGYEVIVRGCCPKCVEKVANS